ncbi:MAG: hypothetical protein KAS36_00460, partial [Anaerolineales bacterium]|nr:hypothetical protein [Anaerolineales bacterium]
MSFTSYLGTIMFALATLARPEGIVVFLLVRLLSWIIPAFMTKDFHIGSKLFLVELSHFGIFGLILLPNILFNLSIAETPWPNTFPAHAGNQGLIMAIGNLDFAEVLRSITLYPLRTLPSLIIYMGMDSLVLLLWLPFCIFT